MQDWVWDWDPCHCSQAQSGDKTRSVASFVAELEFGARSVAAILARTGECRDIAVPLIFSWFRPG